MIRPVEIEHVSVDHIAGIGRCQVFEGISRLSKARLFAETLVFHETDAVIVTGEKPDGLSGLRVNRAMYGVVHAHSLVERVIATRFRLRKCQMDSMRYFAYSLT